MMDPVTIVIPRGDNTSGGVIKLASLDASTFINIILEGNGEYLCKSASPDNAKALRDALIKIYPLPEAPAITAEPSEYTTRAMFGRWEIVHDVPSTDIEIVGYADDQDSAARIAKALNESEGL